MNVQREALTLSDAGANRAARKLRPWLAPTLVALAVIGSVYLASPNYRWQEASREAPFAGDFLQEWIGGHVVLSGDGSRFYDVAYAKELQHHESLVGFSFDRRKYLPLVYPPFYYLAVSPLSLAPLRASAWIWSALLCAAFGGSAVLAARHSKTFLEARSWAWWALPAATVFPPLLESLNSGQKGTVCLLLLSATYYLLSKGKPITAGLVFGLLAFKPQLAIVIAVAMLLKGQWRFVAGGAMCGTALVGASLLVGVDVCRQYVAFSTGAAEYIHTAGYDLHESHCLYGFFSLLFDSPNAAKTATALAMLLVGGVLARILRGRLAAGTARFDLQFSALIIATALCSPHLYTYDLTILLLPMFLLARRLFEDEHTRQRALLVGLLAGLYFAAGLSPSIAAAINLQITTIFMAATLLLLSRMKANQVSV
jgi:hypothetical protein